MNERFEKRLDALGCDDIAPLKKQNRSVFFYSSAAIRGLLFIICLAVFVYAVYNLIGIYSSYVTSVGYYDNVKNQFDSENNTGLTGTVNYSPKVYALKGFEEMLKGEIKPIEVNSDEELEQLIFIRNKLTSIKKEIPELYGWIRVEGTNIDYPLVQSADNLYYVDHGANMELNEAGAIFVDSSCISPTYDTENLLIYGHNIRTLGVMFNGIVYFFEKQYFDSHKSITLYTFDGIYEYTVFSVYETVAGGEYTTLRFANADVFKSFIKKAVDSSANKRENLQYDENSRLITLSTCSNYISDSSSRYVLVGIMTNSITDK